MPGAGPRAAADPAELYRAPDPYAGAADTGSCADEEQAAAVAALNAARTAAGAGPVQCLPKLAQLAAAHAAYLAETSGATAAPHTETPGLAGYTGATLAARADAAGVAHAAFWLAEGVSAGAAPDAAIAAQLATVYHREALLTPGARYLGFADRAGGAAHAAVVETLAWVQVDGLAPSHAPGAGAVGVPTTFDPHGEAPDPAPAAAGLLGYPVSVSVPRFLRKDGKEAPPVQARRLSLTLVGPAASASASAAGALISAASSAEVLTPVAAQILTAATDPHLAASDAVLLPAAPLHAAAQYRVDCDLSYGSYTFQSSWDFTTAAP